VNDVQYEPPGFVDTKPLDGVAVVHFLPTTNVGTFNEYADQGFLPHITNQLESCTRIDIVWDTYLPNSIKQSAKENEEKESIERCQGTINCLENGLNFYMIQLISKKCWNFFPAKLQIGIVLLTNILSLHLALQSSLKGCDSTSTFYGRGKESMWKALKCFNNVMQAFIYIALHPFIAVSIDYQQFQLLERFTVIVVQ